MSDEYKMTLIIEDGKPSHETCEAGINMPANYTFECINHFVHHIANYEDLEALALGMASKLEKLEKHANALVDDLHCLINESDGVAGLHLNGNIANWDELTKGGACEWWLSSLDELQDLLKEKNEP